ncbi:MAG: phosphoglucosamine mutase [Bacteroidales bacterium]
MALITSISGIRGTIGGRPGEGLTPADLLKYITAYAGIIAEGIEGRRAKVVVGRDGRTSGAAINRVVCGTLQLSGVDVIDLGLSTTPSVEMAVVWHKADGGIIITASHNPAEWNALKLLDSQGEFISAEAGERLLMEAEKPGAEFPLYSGMGEYATDYQSVERHIDAVLDHPLVNAAAIRAAGFRVAFDGINSTGGIALPMLLKELGTEEIIPLNEVPDGRFSHNPEPLPEHLSAIRELVVKRKCDVGFVVDPDVDRLAVICEDGTPFGEEYTLVAVADLVLASMPGDTVSNLSSSRALRDVTAWHGGTHHASAVGEVNVVDMMKQTGAVIGGEGNGGVILPSLHYGRDALIGIALFLTLLAKRGVSCSALRKTYPEYVIRKHKVVLDGSMDADMLLEKFSAHFPANQVNRTDGVKVDFAEGWVHLRKSNTEPILRIYAEAATAEEADKLARLAMEQIENQA